MIPGLSGEFFDAPTVESLCAALEKFEASDYEPAALRAHAKRFDRTVFQRELAAIVENAAASGVPNRPG